MIRLERATILTPEREIPDGALLIDGERITYAGPRLDAPPAGPGDEVVALPGRALIPGFVNAHTHIPMQILRGIADDVALMPWLQEHIWPVEERMSEEDILAGSRLALLEAVSCGVTAINDMYGRSQGPGRDTSMDRVAEAMLEAGIRGVICKGLIGLNDPDFTNLEDGKLLFERWNGARGGRIQVAMGPHAPYTCPPPYLAKVADVAQALGARVHIHLAETHGETRDLLAQGTAPARLLRETGISRSPVIAAHYVAPAEEDWAELPDLRIGVAHCPISNLKLGCGVAPVSRLRAAGVPVGLGSDGVASANTLDPFLSMKAAAWMAKGFAEDPSVLPARTVLRLATREGALALGLPDVGELAVGFVADVVVVDLRGLHLEPVHDVASALVYSAGARDVERVYASGRELYREGRHLTVDVAAIRSAAQASALRLTGRPPVA